MKPAAFLTLALLAACARSEDASVRPAESNDSEVEQVRATSGDEREPALGQWRMALLGDRPALEFGSQGTAPLITFVCGERGGLVLQRAGALPPGAAPTLSVSVGGQGRQLQVAPGTGATASQNASIAPGDTLIQQLAAAQAPIALRFGDGTPLILPHHPLIGQFAQSCASGGTRRVAGTAEANGVDAASGSNASAGTNETNAAVAR